MDADVIARTRQARGLSVRQLSELAGVSPSTASRVERGEMVPSIDVLESLLGALGVDVVLEERADADAIAAARWLCGDRSVGRPANDRWIDRYRTLGDAGSASALCWRASRFAPFAKRAVAELTIDGLAGFASAVGVAGDGFAWTGSAAADWYSERPAGTGQVWLYASEPERFVADLSGAVSGPGATKVLVAPLDDTAAAGCVTVDGTRIVAPLQAAIDCFSGPGRMSDQAWAVLDRLGVASG